MPVSSKLSWDSLDHDFGICQRGEVVKHAFTLTNTGKVAMHLGPPRPDCLCTGAKLSHTVVRPGEKAQVEIDLRIPWHPADVNARCIVSTVDGESYSLRVHAEVESRLKVSPATLDFGRLEGSASRTAIVVCTSPEDIGVDLKLVENDVPILIRRHPMGKNLELECTMLDSETGGPVKAELRIYSKAHPSESSVLTLRAYQEGGWVAQPERVLLRRTASDLSPRAIVRLTAQTAKKEPPVCTCIGAIAEIVEARYTSADDGSGSIDVIAFDRATQNTGVLRGAVKLRSADGDSTLLIPVTMVSGTK